MHIRYAARWSCTVHAMAGSRAAHLTCGLDARTTPHLATYIPSVEQRVHTNGKRCGGRPLDATRLATTSTVILFDKEWLPMNGQTCNGPATPLVAWQLTVGAYPSRSHPGRQGSSCGAVWYGVVCAYDQTAAQSLCSESLRLRRAKSKAIERCRAKATTKQQRTYRATGIPREKATQRNSTPLGPHPAPNLAP